MEIKASATYLRISPRKLRLLAKSLRGQTPQKALEKLQFYPQKGKEFLIKVIKQALANAKNNFKITKNLKIKEIQVGDGPAFKRLDKSHGARFDRGIIKKRTAHLYLTLEAPEKKSPESKAKAKNNSLSQPTTTVEKTDSGKKQKQSQSKVKQRSKNGTKS